MTTEAAIKDVDYNFMWTKMENIEKLKLKSWKLIADHFYEIMNTNLYIF